MTPPAIVCVKVGDKYDAEYVNRLFAMVESQVTRPHVFICLTDAPEGLKCTAIPINSTLPGWWTKLILFKPHNALINRRVIFLDLDTIIINNIDFLFDYEGPFAILRDFYYFEGFGSAIMSIAPGFGKHIWTTFNANVKMILDNNWGDQDWIRKQVREADLWQNMFPEKIVSYKVHCTHGVPSDAAIVCFHGHPKPHDLTVTDPLRLHWENNNVFLAK